MDTRLPVDGKGNRVSFDVGTYENENAFGAAYVGVKGSFDYSIGFAKSGSEDMLKKKCCSCQMGLQFAKEMDLWASLKWKAENELTPVHRSSRWISEPV